MSSTPQRRLACVEIGGGGVETVLLGDGDPVVLSGPHLPPGWPLLMAVPGLIRGGRVLTASNLGWEDVDPAGQLGLSGTAAVVLNDAEAAALGEAALRNAAALTYVGLGTGVGGAVVSAGGVVAANLLGHGGDFSDSPCPCGRVGCLETVAAGWALPDPLPAPMYVTVAEAVAAAIRAEPQATSRLVVVAGGLPRRHPKLVDAIRTALPEHDVERSAAPADVKSAAAWGLARAYEQHAGAVA